MSARFGSLAVCLVAVCAGVVMRADAQRYVVAVGTAGTSQVSFIEFRPCIPAEGSGCGAWVDHVADGGDAPSVVNAVRTSNGHATVAIHNGSVIVTSLVRPDSGRAKTAKGLHGAATALAVSADSQYAFVVTEGGSGEPAEVSMIDLDWKSVIARVRLTAAPAGIAMAR